MALLASLRSGKEKKLTTTAFSFFCSVFCSAKPFPVWDQRMHVLTNGCWRVVCFWLNVPKQTGDAQPFPDCRRDPGLRWQKIVMFHPKPTSLESVYQGFRIPEDGKGPHLVPDQDAAVFETGRPHRRLTALEPGRRTRGTWRVYPTFCPGIDNLRHTTNKTVRPTSRRIPPRRLVDVPRLSRVLRGSVPGCDCQPHVPNCVPSYIVQHARDTRL